MLVILLRIVAHGPFVKCIVPSYSPAQITYSEAASLLTTSKPQIIFVPSMIRPLNNCNGGLLTGLVDVLELASQPASQSDFAIHLLCHPVDV